MDMADGAPLRIVVKNAKGQSKNLGFLVEPSDQVRAADGAKASMLSGRRHVVANQVLASDPTKLGRPDFAASAESRTVRLSAHRAMAIKQVDDGPVYFERHPLA